MKILNKLASTAIMVLMLSACTDLSDEIYDTIPGEDYPENEAQGSRLAAPAFLKLKGYTTDWGGYWMSQEITGDGIVAPTRGKDWDDGGKWRDLHTHNWGADSEAVRGIWKEEYDGITECNQAIELLEPNQENAEIQTIISQLKILRAFYYYLLIDSYGDVPYITSYFNVVEEFPSRVARATVFNNLVTEINDNIQYLPDASLASAINKGSAYALLAKLYINAEVYTGTAKWQEASDACDALIALGNYQLADDVKAPFIEENQDSKENIFTIPYDKDNLGDFNLHMRTLHYQSNATFNMAVQPWNGFCLIEDHFNTYADNDKRKAWFLYGEQFAADGTSLDFELNPFVPALNMDGSVYSKEEYQNSGARVIKFEITSGAGQDISNDFPIFRYADFLLIKAEAMVKLGQSGDQYINEVRSRAGLANLSNASLEDIYTERGKEMIWEGCRRQDMIRFGKFNQAWWEKGESPSYRNLFPVPQVQIDANPNLLPQNTGY